jgi:hypothetical protein
VVSEELYMYYKISDLYDIEGLRTCSHVYWRLAEIQYQLEAMMIDSETVRNEKKLIMKTSNSMPN